MYICVFQLKLLNYMCSNLKLESDCESIQTEISSLETSIDETQKKSLEYHQALKQLGKKMDKIQNEESALNTDIMELSQVLQEEVTVDDFHRVTTAY